MKNLFNDISREEKQRILEMHGVKRNLISEEPTGSDFSPYCMKCNQPDISCGKGKLTPQNINQLASQLKTEILEPAKISLKDITGGKFKKVVRIFENLKATGGNFHDFCAIVNEYQKLSSTDLCTDMARIDRKESAIIKGILDSLETVPCQKPPVKKTPIKKTPIKKNPIKKNPIQKPTPRPTNPNIPNIGTKI